MSYRVKIVLGYDGTHYKGWQKQNHTEKTIQNILEKKVSKLFNEPIQVVGAGRTDAGVHALGQVAHFTTTKDPRNYHFLSSLNKITPKDIVIKKWSLVPKSFHALLNSQSKIYTYLIWNHDIPHPIYHRYTDHIKNKLDLNWLNKTSHYLIKKQDFRSFQNQGSTPVSTIKEVFSAQWEQKTKYLVTFNIHLDGALKQMVRNIVGTLIQLHRRSRESEKFLDILKAKNRQKASQSAPSKGLYLKRVFY